MLQCSMSELYGDIKLVQAFFVALQQFRDDLLINVKNHRHCERSKAIHEFRTAWTATLRSQ